MILFLGRYLIGVLECHQLMNLKIQISIVYLLQPEKKGLVVCLVGCADVSVFDSGDDDRKKKVLVVCLAGCAVVSVFGSGGK